MSQRDAGADDWWQKLYEDPDAGPEPDPRDTLEHRFRSAAVLVAPTPVPHPRRDPASVPEDAAPEPEPAVAAPGAAAEPEPPVVVRAPVSEVEAAPPVARSRADDASGGSVLPPPRDPREGGQTWYALGSVSVPPALPAEESEEPSDWSWGPRDDPPAAEAPAEAPAEADPAGAEPGSDGAHAGSGHPEPADPDAVAPDASDPVPDVHSGHGSDPRSGVVSGSHPETGFALGSHPGSGAGWGSASVSGDGDGGSGFSGVPRPVVAHLGDRPPTYAAEPIALPAADPAGLVALTPDTVLEGAQYGGYTLRAASVRGDSARFRGEARRDFLLTARFGTGPDALVLVVLAGGDRAGPGAAEAAAEVCRSVAAAVGRSQERLSQDIRDGRREALRSGLQRLTDRGYGQLRARAAELGLPEDGYTAGLRGVLLPVDPGCRTRVCFGAGAGGLFRLRDGQWRDLEEPEPAPAAPPGPPAGPAGFRFRFRASVARPGDTLLLCSGGLADPMREEEPLSAELAARWADAPPPGLAAFLADTQLRLKGYADDRTAAAVWEA
ncbi:protein phosphatase 2C domain-containing protein [Streptomyces sp. NPDC058401]|uniref:protein phosphatase 2C domain-containing protein n=1 Tax=Streptomyces sp. NPDC058401 TaxID=3346480 RepID=UPI00365C8387